MPRTEPYSPEVFTIVPMSMLSRDHFDSHPIWSEYYEPDEVDEIIDWGVPPERVNFLRERGAGCDVAYPILRPHPLPGRMRLYIRANFTSPRGHVFDGYVVTESAYAIALFVGHDKFMFNSGLSDLGTTERRRLAQLARCPLDPIFPLKYKTDFLGNDNRLIEGTFEFRPLPPNFPPAGTT